MNKFYHTDSYALLHKPNLLQSDIPRLTDVLQPNLCIWQSDRIYFRELEP